MNREELTNYGVSLGYKVTNSQIERWHKCGILPAPKQKYTLKVNGSISEYPESAKDNLQLLLTSKESARNLNGLLLDVWLRGGQIESHFIKEILLGGVFKQIEEALKTKVASFLKIEKSLINGFNKKKTIFSSEKMSDVSTSINVIFSILSPDLKDRIWHGSSLETTTGELAAGEILHKTMGTSSFNSSTDDSIFDDMKEILNVKAIRSAIKLSTDHDLEKVRTEMNILERVIKVLINFDVYDNQTLKILKIYKYFSLTSVSSRSMFLISLLVADKANKLNDWSSTWLKHIDGLEWMGKYIAHMKNHKLLKKRKNWARYFELCNVEELTELKTHQLSFFNQNPDFERIIGGLSQAQGENVNGFSNKS
ncbi:hypothetical protein [Paenibacillus sp. Leaf72]|uniref:hypothetical protein n=1 Tax=Paenibacillus sp. Leaf72 TaxID=1736234 RepID=UPI0006FE386D|nr:hypothetical protein [Paenibacillus sp. Leaf72]KQN96761.1 hypothetical protein ASF12_22060 [Paenibacillus sp. Leaf72]